MVITLPHILFFSVMYLINWWGWFIFFYEFLYLINQRGWFVHSIGFLEFKLYDLRKLSASKFLKLKCGKVFKLRILLNYLIYFCPHSNVLKLLSSWPFGFKCPICRLSLIEVERTWSRDIVRGCFRLIFIHCYSFLITYALITS